MPTDPSSRFQPSVHAVRCVALRVAYGDVGALCGIDIAVARGEIVALLGASGSGKSTLLQAIAGLVEPSAGEIWIGGKQVTGGRRGTPPERRDVGMVFQNFALWPHLSVLDTVAYPMRRAGRDRASSRADAMEVLDRLGIAQLAHRRPAEVSGGEQQRVGLARALARDAHLYLLDEPTAHLDTHLRTAFTESVLSRQRESGAAVLYATHDAAEALALADRVAVLVGGTVVQCGPPTAVYDEPVSEVAARLSGPCSVLSVRVCSAGDDVLVVDLGDGPVSIPGGVVTGRDGAAKSDGRPDRLLVRPDWSVEGGPLRGRTTGIGFRGPHTDYRLSCSAGSLLLQIPGAPRHAVGDEISFSLRRGWLLGDEPDAGRPPPA